MYTCNAQTFNFKYVWALSSFCWTAAVRFIFQNIGNLNCRDEIENCLTTGCWLNGCVEYLGNIWI